MARQCTETCPGGQRCTCSIDPTHARRHELHICADERCYCHTLHRYRNERRPAHDHPHDR